MRKSLAELVIAIGKVLQVQLIVLINKWIDHIHLPAQINLLRNKLINGHSALNRIVQCLHRLAPRWQLIYHTHLQVAIHRHCQRAGDRRGGHNQHMRRLCILVPQLSTLRYTKTVLLINDTQAQIGKLHIIFNQRMRTDKNINLARAQLLVNGLTLLGSSGTRK